jgi:hypothetical protein
MLQSTITVSAARAGIPMPVVLPPKDFTEEAMIDPFPYDAVRAFVTEVNVGTRYLFALSNAQRAVTMAGDDVGSLVEEDRRIVDATLESCWTVAQGNSSEELSQYVDPLYSRMVPDWEDEYSPYNSAVNSALAALVYAIAAFNGEDPINSAYWAATSMNDIADYLLHRNLPAYVDDLATTPITALAAQCVVKDMERLASGAVPRDLRQLVIDEGHRIASLAP